MTAELWTQMQPSLFVYHYRFIKKALYIFLNYGDSLIGSVFNGRNLIHVLCSSFSLPPGAPLI